MDRWTVHRRPSSSLNYRVIVKISSEKWNEKSVGNVEKHSNFEKRSRQLEKTLIFYFISDLDYFTENSKKDK